MYTCTYYGRQDHLAKFCYDKLNAYNSHVWVHKTNILGTNKVWGPKLTPTLHDIGNVPRLKDVESGGTLIVVAQGT